MLQRKSHTSKGQGFDGFEYVIVGDITEDGAFDEAVKDVNTDAHLAAPFYTTGIKNPQELIDPAVKGTIGILKSIQKNNPNVKRVVITSSVEAIRNAISRKAPPITYYTEDIWNEDAVPHVEANGKDSDGYLAYQASKTLAERALWKFTDDKKPTWDAVAINPPYVLGEVIHEVDKPEKLNTSVEFFWAWITGQKTEADLPSPFGNWVNVKDVAEAHVRALEVAEASGQRFITGAGAFSGQDYVDILRKRYPELPNIPFGHPGINEEILKETDIFVGSKAEKVLGIRYTSLEETVVQMADSRRKRLGKL
ncbi:hypothetical protein IAT40_007602 [Kwoniella sp. CBS 6097]